MRIRLERGDVIFEYETRPMPEGRFRTVCGLTAAGVYAGLVITVAALCGLLGVIVVGVLTLFGVMAVCA